MEHALACRDSCYAVSHNVNWVHQPSYRRNLSRAIKDNRVDSDASTKNTGQQHHQYHVYATDSWHMKSACMSLSCKQILQPFNGLWSGRDYQKKQSPTHTQPVHQASFINCLYLLRYSASCLFSLRARQSSDNLSPGPLWSVSWPSVVRGNWTRVVLFCCIFGCLLFMISIEFVYLYFPVLFCLSVSVMWLAVKTASEMTYRPYCVEWGVKLYSNQSWKYRNWWGRICTHRGEEATGVGGARTGRPGRASEVVIVYTPVVCVCRWLIPTAWSTAQR